MGTASTDSRLLDVAIDHFGRLGLEGASTRAIARDAETLMSSITYHFGGKEGLYLGVEERRGMLYGFRFRDRADFKSCAPDATPGPLDQKLGIGDGAQCAFQLSKTYGAAFAPYARDICKPVAGSVRVAVNGVEKVAGTDFDVDVASGIVTFRNGLAPPHDSVVTAGFLFDVPVRFDSDYLEVDFSAFDAGEIPKIPIIEIQP
jgi:uncharacterized protein (TIGR02217 family)